MEVQRELLFPTIVYRFQLPDPEVTNSGLLEGIRAHRRRDSVGYEVSNLGGWHSHNRLQDDPTFTPMVGMIEHACAHMADDLGYGYPLELSTLWAIVNRPGDSNEAHIHSGAMWSGVYYVAAPENGGDLKLIDPRTEHRMQRVLYGADRRPDICRKHVRVTPQPGLMVVFPAWLYHSVLPNRSKLDRIILSFNLRQRMPGP